MDGYRPDHFGGLPPTHAYRVDAVCRRFEAEWRGGGEPRIEDYLARADPSQQVALFRELLALEVELRQGRGERPDPCDYRARFPEHAATIGAVMGSESGAPARGGSSLTEIAAAPVPGSESTVAGKPTAGGSR